MIHLLFEQSPFPRLPTFVRSCSLRMSSGTDLGMNALSVPLGYPIFGPEYPHIWFLQQEASLKLCSITKQRMLFWHAIAALPSNVTSLVVDDAQKKSALTNSKKLLLAV
nr:hypothetical transcript [Hymenolepis microstoma]